VKVLYHIPSLDSIYAHRTIYHGYRNAFLDLGHEFQPFTLDHRLDEVLQHYRPDLFITASHSFYRRQLDYALLRRFRNEGLRVLVKIDFWDSPLSALRINEAKSLKDEPRIVDMIASGELGDFFFHVVEQDDPRMAGFSERTGRPFYTVPLAADRIALKPAFDPRFDADISYVGTSLPEKRAFFKEHVFPLGRRHTLRIYGQDWSRLDRSLAWVQRAGQYLNIKPLARLRKPRLQLEDEARIYASSKVSINVHEEYQRRFGGDCNERTFKIPFCGGFEVVDQVACLDRYFERGRELAVASTGGEWVDMVEHYLRHPEARASMIDAGRQRVARDHTYHNRVAQLLSLRPGP
jgi:spore maturation protein CgeB